MASACSGSDPQAPHECTPLRNGQAGQAEQAGQVSGYSAGRNGSTLALFHLPDVDRRIAALMRVRPFLLLYCSETVS